MPHRLFWFLSKLAPLELRQLRLPGAEPKPRAASRYDPFNCLHFQGGKAVKSVHSQGWARLGQTTRASCEVGARRGEGGGWLLNSWNPVVLGESLCSSLTAGRGQKMSEAAPLLSEAAMEVAECSLWRPEPHIVSDLFWDLFWDLSGFGSASMQVLLLIDETWSHAQHVTRSSVPSCSFSFSSLEVRGGPVRRRALFLGRPWPALGLWGNVSRGGSMGGFAMS